MPLPERQPTTKSSHKSSSDKDIAALKAKLEKELRNKKQCTHKSYECTQLSLDGFNYCLKHIQQDKSAPFKQCSYVYSSNGKRCQFAAPKIDKRDYGYCNEHAVRATLAKNRQNSRHPPQHSAEVLLHSLGHYVKTAPGCSDESDQIQTEDGLDQKTTKSLDPFKDLDANKIIFPNSSNMLDFCSESDSDIEPSTFTTVWHDAQNDSSDSESIDSDQEDVLKHGNVFTAEEITSRTREKLLKLQSLYIEQYKHLQHIFKECKRKYVVNLKREKETCCNIYNQVRDNSKEQRLYRKLKALNKYHKTRGVEAILDKRANDYRAKMSEGVFYKNSNFPKCMFSEGGVKCGERTLPLARHCRKHIFEDSNQVLFRQCGKKKGDMACSTPVEAIFEDACCNLHMDIPAIKSYAQIRKNSESDFEDSYESPENLLMDSVSEKVKTEFIDYNLEIDDMKTLPALLFEESSMDDSVNNGDGEKTGDEDCTVDMEIENEDSHEGKLEIDLNDVNNANSCEKEENVELLNAENATDIKSDITNKLEELDKKVEDCDLQKDKNDIGLE